MRGKFLQKAVFELNLETHKEYDHLEMGKPGVVGEEWCISFLAKRTEQAFLQGFQILLLTLEICFNRVSLLRYSKTLVTLSPSVVSDSATPWTVACQAPLSMGFSRRECWSGLPFPSPGIEPTTPALQEDSLFSEPSEQSAKFSAVSNTPASKAVRNCLFGSNNHFNGIPRKEHQYNPHEFLLLFHYWIYCQVLSFNHLHCARTVVYSWLLKEEKPQIFKKSLFSF